MTGKSSDDTVTGSCGSEVAAGTPAAPRLLVAGVGNIFWGDDAFGITVVQRLVQEQWLESEPVDIVDFGIRSFDLACALSEYSAAILVDLVDRGGAPGSLKILDLSDSGVTNESSRSAHQLSPESALALAEQYGGRPHWIRLVGCQPADLTPSEGAQLSDIVECAVRGACELVRAQVLAWKAQA